MINVEWKQKGINYCKYHIRMVKWKRKIPELKRYKRIEKERYGEINKFSGFKFNKDKFC